MRRPFGLAAGAALMMACGSGALRAQTPSGTDPYLWLEEAQGARAMSWVAAENKKTADVLERDPRFKTFETQAFDIISAKDRIPTPSFLAGDVYNFWQDAVHVRGIWRKTTLGGYAGEDTKWSTVFDLDAYAAAAHANWFFKGAECERVLERRCILSLSDGGEDAVTMREFDLPSASFVQGGFELPKGKQSASYETEDTLLVARAWSPGELTASGYPYVVKRLRRGQPLEAASEVYRGAPTDVGVDPFTLVDGLGHRVSFIRRGVSFFQSETYLVTDAGVRKLGLPMKSSLRGLVAGRVLATVEEPFSSGGVAVPAGALVSFDLAALKADPEHLRPEIIFAPGPRQSLGDVAVTKTRVVLTSYDNVQGRASVFRPTPSGWSAQALPVGDLLTLGVYDADLHSERAFLGEEGFLTPTRVSLIDAVSGARRVVKSLPPKFDASRDEVDQSEAASSDGVKIPYFIVHPKGMRLDGTNPALMTAYGGFQVSLTPDYSGVTGKLWLERGGVFVLANIRGGGEFGPKWHEAGLKTKRQIIYDDFAAVAKDLVDKGITSPRRLGIYGGSNGGLLMGVEFVEHPDYWRAVSIEVPLLDMLRYEKIAAGASWVGEYGSVSNPEEAVFLAKISPYANLKAGVAYPEPFIWTTTKDDRVGPQHARKFAAKLAALGDPYLFYEVTEGGHGAGANLEERAKTEALEYTYFTEKLVD